MNSFYLTVDFWTEPYTGKTYSFIVKSSFPCAFYKGLPYCSLSLGYVDLQFQLQTFLIGCYPYQMENKHAPTIRSFIDTVLNELGLKLNQEKFFMSDNEPTMKCTFNSNCKRVGCSDHYLNKQMQHAFTSKIIDGENFNCESAQDMFDDVKRIVSSARRMHKQQDLSKNLVIYSDTRFGGAFNMLVVFSDVFDEVAEILDSKLFTIYSRINKDLLSDICEFLSPFITVLETLSDNK